MAKHILYTIDIVTNNIMHVAIFIYCLSLETSWTLFATNYSYERAHKTNPFNCTTNNPTNSCHSRA